MADFVKENPYGFWPKNRPCKKWGPPPYGFWSKNRTDKKCMGGGATNCRRDHAPPHELVVDFFTWTFPRDFFHGPFPGTFSRNRFWDFLQGGGGGGGEGVDDKSGKSCFFKLFPIIQGSSRDHPGIIREHFR